MSARTGTMPMFRSITRDGARHNGSPVKEKKAVSDAPAALAPRAPADLIAQEIRHRHPEKAGDDEDVSKHGHEQTARFISEKRRVEKRFRGEQKQNAKSAGRQKFVDIPKHEKKTDRQNNKERRAKAGEFSHFHGSEE